MEIIHFKRKLLQLISGKKMNPEQSNLVREKLKAILFHTKPAQASFGWRSEFVLTFTEDEMREMKKIIKDLSQSKTDLL